MYFKRNFYMIGPLECLVSPNKKVLLFRLPQNLMTCKKWSRIQLATFDESFNSVEFKPAVADIHRCALQDRRFQALAFNPRNSAMLVLVLVDEFCSKCKFRIYDFIQAKEVFLKIHRLGDRSTTIHTTKGQDLDDDNACTDTDSSDEDNTYYHLQQCSVAITRDTDVIILCCIVIDNRQTPYVKMYLYGSDDLHCVASFQQNVSGPISAPTIRLLQDEPYTLVISTCDSTMAVWNRSLYTPTPKCVFVAKIPHKVCLKSLCRKVIQRHTDTSEICNLPLPRSLLDYLQFKS
jgi:hypothetical protein